MKYICAILAFLVLSLSVQPVCASTHSFDSCCEESTCGNDNGSEQEEQKDCAACNPFQLCGCCAFSVVPAPSSFLVFHAQPNFIHSFWLSYSCPFIEEPVLGFWQPPKLA